MNWGEFVDRELKLINLPKSIDEPLRRLTQLTNDDHSWVSIAATSAWLVALTKGEVGIPEDDEKFDYQISRWWDAIKNSSHKTTISLLFRRLVFYKPLTPLLGIDSEWKEIDDGGFQNLRCPSVFKRNGEAYDVDAIAFRKGKMPTYGAGISLQVEFPYYPVTRILKITDPAELIKEIEFDPKEVGMSLLMSKIDITFKLKIK